MTPAPDVAVVGGGIVGTTLAMELAGRGLRVVLHDRAEVAAGASGRNSGAVWRPLDPVMEALYLETLGRYRELPQLLAAHLPDGHPARAFRLGERPVGILTLGTDQDRLAAAARRMICSPRRGCQRSGSFEMRSNSSFEAFAWKERPARRTTSPNGSAVVTTTS